MQLISRQRRVLEILINNQDKFLSSDQIADFLGISYKTVQTDIKVLRDVMSSYELKIDSVRGKGYVLRFEGTDKLDLINILNKIRIQRRQNVDVSLFICKVLTHRLLYTTQQEIMDLLWISAGQMKELLNKVVLELSQHKLIIKSIPGSGFLIMGPELAKRLAFVYHFSVLESDQTMFNRFLRDIGVNKIITDYDSIEIINDLLSNQGYFLNTISKKYLLYYINYIKIRANNKLAIMHTYHTLPYFDGLEIGGHDELFELCNSNYTELRYLKSLLFLLVNESDVREKIQYTPKELHLEQKVENFFNRRPELFNNSFYDVRALKDEVLKSLIIIMRRNSIGYREFQSNFYNIDKEDENVVAIEFASLLLFKIENDMQIEFYQEDIIKLAMIFNINFYKDLWAKYNRFIIYSDYSLTQVKFLKRKLQVVFSSVKVLEVNHKNIEELEVNEEKDLFIYGIESDKRGFRHEIVFESLIMVPEIIQYLQNYVNDMAERKRTFLDLFSSERFHHNLKFKDLNEIVSWICDIYETGEERKSVIQRNVYTREIRYIPTVYNRAAYPKIYVNNIDTPVIEVISLKNPVLWGQKEVDVIFAVVLPNSYNSLNILGRPFNQIRENANLIQRIKNSKTFVQMMEYIKKEIDRAF